MDYDGAAMCEEDCLDDHINEYEDEVTFIVVHYPNPLGMV